MSKVISVAISIGILSLSPATLWAAEWSPTDVDKALTELKKSEESGVGECVRSAGTEVEYAVKQIDLNGDGINELEVQTFPKELGQGATGCYGHVGQHIYLLTFDGADGWKQEFGFDTGAFEYRARPSGKFADIELTGPGFCFPIWRHHEGRYGLWKVCDGQIELFADVAPWIKEGAVPRDAGEDLGPIEQPDLAGIKFQAPEFDHNGSLMGVDHRQGVIYYKVPKKSISGTIKPGTVVFKGEPWDQYDIKRSIKGTAYVFRKGCKPEPYEVAGGFSMSWHTIVLRGAAPVRKKPGCDVDGYSAEDGNAVLEFLSLVD